MLQLVTFGNYDNILYTYIPKRMRQQNRKNPLHFNSSSSITLSGNINLLIKTERIMFRCLILLLIASTNSFGQHKSIADTTIIFGIVREDCFVGTEVSSYCTNGINKSLSSRTAVIVCGAKSCIRDFSKTTSEFYEISYNNKIYFIERDNLFISKDYSFEDILNKSNDDQSSFRNHALENSKLLYESELRNAVNFLKKCKSPGLAILNWSIYDESEYTEGTSVKITVYNPTSKTIKYIWLAFEGINAVGDKVVDRRRSASSITRKSIGPIEPEENATYDYKYVWFTDLVETANITSIKIQYMDGTFKTISNPKSIIMERNVYELISDVD
jgi:hypothetical protein